MCRDNIGQILGPVGQSLEQIMLEFIADGPKWFSVLTAVAEYIAVQPRYALDPDVQIFPWNPFEEGVRQNQQIVRLQGLDAVLRTFIDVQEDMAMVEGAKQGNMGCDHRCLEIAPPVKIPDQNVKGQQPSRLVGIIPCNDTKLAWQGVRKGYAGQSNLKAGVGQTITRNRQYAISNRNLERLGKPQGNEFVVDKVRGFGRVKLENTVNRTGNRSRGAGRASLQASGGVDAVGGNHLEYLRLWMSQSDINVKFELTWRFPNL